MKRRPMTLGRRVELFFGPLLSTMVIGPALGIMVLLGLISGPPDSSILVLHLLIRLSTIFLIGMFLAAPVVSLWLLVLYGPEQISERPLLRWFTIAVAILGIPSGAYALLALSIVSKSYAYVAMALLVGPVIIWLRYLPWLITRAK